MYRLTVSFVVCLFAGVTGAAAQGIGCNDPQTQNEMNRCAYEMWQLADEDLNHDYKMARDALIDNDQYLPDDLKGGPDALLRAQRAWIVFRDEACAAEASVAAGGSMQPLLEFGCKERLTRQRSEGLRYVFEVN